MLLPRGKLIYTVGGQVVLQSPYGQNMRDENNGPKPVRFDVVKQGGGKVLHVEFEVETWINECPVSGHGSQYSCVTPQASNLILSNRFSISEELNEMFLWVRKIQGQVVMSGANIQDQKNFVPPWKDILTFPISEGWKRDGVSVECQPDGLTWSYQVVDKEQFIAVPSPATSVEATFTTNFGAMGNAGLINNDISVTVQGDPDASISALLHIASQIVFSRIKLTKEKAGPGTEWLTAGSITEDIFQNKVNIKLKTNATPNMVTWKGLQVPLTRFGAAINNDDIKDNKARSPEDRYIYWGLLLGQALSSPCEAKTPYIENVFNAKTDAPPTITKPTKSPSDDLQPTEMSRYSLGQTTDNPHLVYDTVVRYETHGHTFQLPVINTTKGTPAYFATAAATTTRKVISWKTSRVGQVPELPAPGEINLNNNDVYLYSTVNIPTTQVEKDGTTQRWTLTGEYVYGMQTPMTTMANIPLPRNPMLAGSPGDANNTIPAAAWRMDILPRAYN
jgi:hypothetical protein